MKRRRKTFRPLRLTGLKSKRQKYEPASIEYSELFDCTNAPFHAWSWHTYVRLARWSMRVTTKRAAARLKVDKWEENFKSYADAGHRRVCDDCGAATTPRDPVFDLCRACERQYRMER